MTTLVIPAAGRATRMRPITSGCSKAMLPINGRPALAYILEQATWADEVIIVDGALPDIRNFVYGRYPRVKCVSQGSLNGPRDALHVGYLHSDCDGPVVCWFCDTLIPDFQPALVDGVYVYPVHDPRPYVMTDGTNYWEKPNECPVDTAVVGVYVFEDRRRLGHALQQTAGEYEMPALLQAYSSYMTPMYVPQWLDVGNIESYYNARAELLNTQAREFNQVHVDTFLGTITKSSPGYSDKIPLERDWYLALDDWQALFAPRVLPSGDQTLVMTLESGVPLADLLVYDDLPISTWRALINRIFRVMHEVMYRPTTVSEANCRHMWVEKNVSRTREIAPDLVEWVRGVGERAVRSARYSTVIHGDLQLSNIIFDPYTGKMKLIDPRGFFGTPGAHGDQQYDMAKLFEELWWGFNTILCGVEFERSDVAIYLDQTAREYGYNTTLLKELGLVMLLTAVPFHSDNPVAQQKFIDTARAYVKGQKVENVQA